MLKKYSFFLLALAVAFLSCTDTSEEINLEEDEVVESTFSRDIPTGPNSIANGRVMSPDDRNLDPNWDWTTSEEITMYLSGESIDDLDTYVAANPFYGQSRLATNSRTLDIFPEDGWVLIARDFGNSLDEPLRGQPFFILYNKYRGILRFVHFTADIRPSSYQIVKLTQERTLSQGGYFAFSSFDPAKSTLADYEANVINEVASQVAGNFGWGVSDFFVGYDPNMLNQGVLKFEIFSVTHTTRLDVASEVDFLTNAIYFQTGSDDVTRSSKVYESSFSFIDAYRSTFPDLVFTDYEEFSVEASPVDIKVSFFLDGISKSSQTQMASFGEIIDWDSEGHSVQYQFEDAITISFDQANWQNDGMSYKSLYNGSVGLLNFKKTPQIAISPRIVKSRVNGECITSYEVSHSLVGSIDDMIALNPDAGITIEAIYAGFPEEVSAQFGSTPNGQKRTSAWASIGDSFFTLKGAIPSLSNTSYSSPLKQKDVMLKVILKANGSTKNVDDTFVLYKKIRFEEMLLSPVVIDQCL